jgi:CheY-like chemotaxis protein
MVKYSPILYAEDDETDVFLFRRALRKSELAIPLVVVHDGQQAVDYLDQPFSDQHPMPGLVLLDLKMPRMNGFDVLAWIYHQPALKQIPVVMLTSSDRPEDQATARQLGAADYLIKPCDNNLLADMVRQLHTRWLEPAVSDVVAAKA